MNSAISTKRGSARGSELQSDPGAVRETKTNAFRPSHFFVLSSLAMATLAVMTSRQSTPEHLVLISIVTGAAGAAGAGFYRMLSPLAVDDVSLSREPISERSRAAVEREKALALRSIKELEFDRAMGKISPADFDEMAGRLRARALLLMKQIDSGGTGYRELIERELAARLAGQSAPPGRVRLPDPDARPKPDTAPANRDLRQKPEATKATPDARVKPEAPATNRGVRQRSDTTAADRDVRASPGASCSCGASNGRDALFCKRCGTRLSEAPL